MCGNNWAVGAEASPAVRAWHDPWSHAETVSGGIAMGVLFLAPDQKNLNSLRDVMKEWMVWKGIIESREQLNLNSQQLRQSEARRDDAQQKVDAQIRERSGAGC